MGQAPEAQPSGALRWRRSAPPAGAAEFLAKLEHAIAASHGYFRRAQHESGYWHRSLEANATMNTRYIVFLHFYLRYDMYRNYFPLMLRGDFRVRVATLTN